MGIVLEDGFETIKALDRQWVWPKNDLGLRAAIDQVYDVGRGINFSKNFNVAIQAGGACGVVPIYMAETFRRVYTFEPSRENFQCLERNTRASPRITIRNVSLGKDEGNDIILLHPSEGNNSGAYYTIPATNSHMRVTPRMTIPRVTIDSLKIKPDFMQLDVEGREFDVLKGAEATIRLHSPVIMIEQKHLPQDLIVGNRPGQAVEFLESLNYEVVDKIHRDVILRRKA